MTHGRRPPAAAHPADGPSADFEQTYRWITHHEFPDDYLRGTSIAFPRDYGVPRVSRLLDRAQEFERAGRKRYADTVPSAYEMARDGMDSQHGRAAGPPPQPHPRPPPHPRRGLPPRPGHHRGRAEAVDRPVRPAAAVRAGGREPGAGGAPEGRDDGHHRRARHLRRLRASARRVRTGDVRPRPRQPRGGRRHPVDLRRVVPRPLPPDRHPGGDRRVGRTPAEGARPPPEPRRLRVAVHRALRTRAALLRLLPGRPERFPKRPKARTYPFGRTLDDLGPHGAHSRPLAPLADEAPAERAVVPEQPSAPERSSAPGVRPQRSR
ncbi:hypothetical protein M2169_005636 [Streptomyces sp. MJP52]|nr:hypothetical protein [Streptomyces sp. MJP52]